MTTYGRTMAGVEKWSDDMEVPYLDLKRSTEIDREAYRDAASQVLSSGWYILGHQVSTFETAWAKYCGVENCVGTGNGLDGLELVLRALDLPPDGEVIVPSNTYIATWLAVTNVGLRVRPVEPDPESFNLTKAGVEAEISEHTVAILGVHLFGRLADPQLSLLEQSHGIPVIFDAAQAHGAKYADASAGSLGRAAAFSFYPTKNLGALGDAGAVTTYDSTLADRVRLQRNYGSRTKYEFEMRGRNSRLDEIQAALLSVALPSLDERNERRREVAAYYSRELSGTALNLPEFPSHPDEHVWHAYNVLTVDHAQRERLRQRLASEGVGTQVFYPEPPHLSDAYRDHGWSVDRFPFAYKFASTSLALPIAPYMTDAEVEYVAAAVKLCLS